MHILTCEISRMYISSLKPLGMDVYILLAAKVHGKKHELKSSLK